MNRFRNLLAVTLAGTALLVGGLQATAQNVITWENNSYEGAPSTFSGVGVTNPTQGQRSNIVWFVASAKGVGVPRIKSIHGLQGDLVAANATFWTATNALTITNNGIAGTNVLYLDSGGAAATGFVASNDLVLIHFFTNDVYQLAIATNVAAGSLGISAGAKYATGTGDRVYKLVNVGTLIEPGVTATNVVPESGVLAQGRMGYPFAVTLEYSNTARLRLVNGEYGGVGTTRRF
jgi:hypothetical protein